MVNKKKEKQLLLPATTSTGTEIKKWTNYDDDFGEGGAYKWHTCKHFRSEIKIGKHTIWYTGSMDTPFGTKLSEWDKPDAAIYLSSQWLSKMGGVASNGIESPVIPFWPFILVDWPDYSTVYDTYFESLVETALGLLAEGKQLEIACQGGHGRTGTLLAGIMAKVEGLTAAEAIKATRERGCKHQVETYGQEDMVYRLLGETPPPIPPTVPTTNYSSANKVVKDSNTLLSELQAKANAKIAGTKPCICGHAKSRHRGRTNCNMCTCPSYVGRKAIDDIDLTLDDYRKMSGVTIQRTAADMYRISDAMSGEVIFMPIPQHELDLMDKKVGVAPPEMFPCRCNHSQRAHSVTNVRGGPDMCKFCFCKGWVERTNEYKMCVCGHLDKTHQYRADDACAFCKCVQFLDSDSYSDEYLQDIQKNSYFEQRTPEEITASVVDKGTKGIGDVSHLVEVKDIKVPVLSDNAQALVDRVLTGAIELDKAEVTNFATGWGMD